MSESLILKVDGITCGHCVNTINKALREKEGVVSAWTSLAEKAVIVDFDPDKITSGHLRDTIIECGYKVIS